MRIIVLFNLKDGVDPAAYEAWARGSDIPAVNALGSVIRFTVHKSLGLFGSGEAAPYQYVEVIDIADMIASNLPAISAGMAPSKACASMLQSSLARPQRSL